METTPLSQEEKRKKYFGDGYRKPQKDDSGKLICMCTNPKPSTFIDHFRCMKCKAEWYH